jgi:hypothetical protein
MSSCCAALVLRLMRLLPGQEDLQGYGSTLLLLLVMLLLSLPRGAEGASARTAAWLKQSRKDLLRGGALEVRPPGGNIVAILWCSCYDADD